ncbi:HPF/RaiA family ribosome-associated protein [Anatilimnocola floriformis]|uniref:HPF/RaiA family ribosome-associated protein n=1 Tax=Anatilimnocola floriformis TaxID=2948575 RepID=UPI0020C52610|nr:HPF/RaiA family ribosome-associated protein [Anatilimnocola floriformis]
MLVQIKTDNHIEGSARLQDWVRDEVTDSLERFTPQLTRAEVFLSDLNSHKNGAIDKQCTVEVHVARLDPIAVTKDAGSLEAALNAALSAITITLDSRVEKMHAKKGRTPMGGVPE